MMRFFAFVGVCFVFAVILSVIIGVVKGLIQRRKLRCEACKNIDTVEENDNV